MFAYLKRVVEAWRDYPLPKGKVLQGRYRIDRFLGIGSYGLTYLCRDMESGTDIVLKQAKPSKKRLGRDLLRREQALLQQLTHPAIPRAYELFQSAGREFLLLEYRRGRTVEDLIFERGQRFGEKEALQLVRRLLDIVGDVHAQGIVHLDIRIPNVLLDGERMSLIDFGLAARLGEPARLPADADEEFIRKRTVAVTSDLYAIGHFLLFMLYSAFETPQEGERNARGECAGERSGSSEGGRCAGERGSSCENGKHASGPPLSGWEQELDVSPATKAMLRKLLQLDPPYPDVRACALALDKLLQHEENRLG
ncbi:protein kinase [Paenibacillus oryzisoli]|uniref:serine/threonine protein kinase n=1 Tax=Paenibacillus oryzisoli TaxID=1850517 RepID=UPI003D2DDFCC